MKSLLFVDSRVAHIDSILAGLAVDGQVIVLDPFNDGLTQIAQALEGVHDLDAIHVISHGSAGALYLGDTVLDSAALPNYTDALQRLGRSLTANGDLLLYGCDVAAGAAGLSFITRLSELTGADVAASTDRTGTAVLGGNAALEAVTGAIEAAPVLTAAMLTAFNGVLDIAPVLANVAATVAYTENAAAVTLAPALTVSDADSTHLISATVAISAGYVAGDELSANVAGTSITAVYSPVSYTLLLNGTDTLAHYQQALASVTFSSTSDNPTANGANTPMPMGLCSSLNSEMRKSTNYRFW
jgi:Domain of unknown function (DUF4347)